MRNKRERKSIIIKDLRKGRHFLKEILIFIFLFIINLLSVQAQVATTTSGGNASGIGGFVSYTVGQVVYNKNNGTNGSEIQGVQQPFEISVTTGTIEVNNIYLDCAVYPNPATDFLILRIEGEVKPNLTASLYNLNGKFLQKKDLIVNETNIPMGNLVPGTYFLRITDEKMEIRSFKIIKNN